MKKILLTLLALVAVMAVSAKIVKIKMADGTMKVFTSSELSSIDFNDDGTLIVTTYDGEVLKGIKAKFDELEIGSEPVIYEQFPDKLSFDIDADGIPVNLQQERSIMKLNYVYPSVDPTGASISLSGTILIPKNLWEGEAKCEGILLFNHYTKFHKDEAPTRENGELENMFLANPLKPNYIIVESDFFGFGATERFPQAFAQGTPNAYATLDGLLAARQLLDKMGFDYGPLLFNVGYSSGGYDALIVQKVRDKEYADQVSFDKTFAGGSPSDICEAYRQYVILDETAYNAVPLLIMVCTKETQMLNIDYKDVFQPYICDRIDELILSKQYSSWPVCDSIGREKKIHEILSDAYCDLESEQSLAMQEVLKTFNVENNWETDPSQRLYIFHSRGDDYVPVQCARPILSYLRENGYTPHIIPGKTNLQTNFIVPKLGHLSATSIFFIQSLAAVAAWPQMYTNDRLNPEYEQLIEQSDDPVELMRQLDAMGIDCRAIIKQVLASLGQVPGTGLPADVDLEQLVAMAIQETGYTEQDFEEMSEDSGVDIEKLIRDFIIYFYELPEDNGENGENVENGDNGNEEDGRQNLPIVNMMQALDSPTLPIFEYQKQLREWLGK